MLYVCTSNVGVKLQKHIEKSLTSRSAAVKAALKCYNEAASELKSTPPAPQYTWEDISSTKVLADVHILHGLRQGILRQAWAQPKNQRCVEPYHWLQRAQEEIEHLNIEICWLSTVITGKGLVLSKMLREKGSRTAGDQWLLQRYAERQFKVNKTLLKELDQIKQLPGYTGWHTTCTYIGQPSIATSNDIEMEAVNPDFPGIPEACGSHASMEDELDDLQVCDIIIEQFDKWQIALDNAKDLPV
ncbi:hypothetical protein RSOLAG1IB_11026 [Rhizoctonia solani AG-1 IB]|uniref:Uncharacterized protein n=2 Tax=Thanatephorus cucumeris (strain AG1-IB / isolate 7/3/14) TaxID=1108050 RepID=A0A0B7G6C2_THACB|nr:hypothetical protein RSOLAG1IB_11026 [Rhizoctonia solani AG-1 IB]